VIVSFYVGSSIAGILTNLHITAHHCIQGIVYVQWCLMVVMVMVMMMIMMGVLQVRIASLGTYWCL
jgi:hypothetical protein